MFTIFALVKDILEGRFQGKKKMDFLVFAVCH